MNYSDNPHDGLGSYLVVRASVDQLTEIFGLDRITAIECQSAVDEEWLGVLAIIGQLEQYRATGELDGDFLPALEGVLSAFDQYRRVHHPRGFQPRRPVLKAIAQALQAGRRLEARAAALEGHCFLKTIVRYALEPEPVLGIGVVATVSRLAFASGQCVVPCEVTVRLTPLKPRAARGRSRSRFEGWNSHSLGNDIHNSPWTTITSLPSYWREGATAHYKHLGVEVYVRSTRELRFFVPEDVSIADVLDPFLRQLEYVAEHRHVGTLYSFSWDGDQDDIESLAIKVAERRTSDPSRYGHERSTV